MTISTDQNFPFITYDVNQSCFEWGLEHGKTFSLAIKELSSIRRELMLQKNPALKDKINSLAMKQFQISKDYAPHVAEELEGIAKGSGVSLEDIIILNNYTDFRDIELPDEGCSSVHIQNENIITAGQTWDMHSTAKNYLALISVPAKEGRPACLVFTLVGCVGMMGYNEDNNLIAVNNINTKNAKSGLIWPVLVRKLLEERNFENIKSNLLLSPVTSGHNYMISTVDGASHFEITPDIDQELFHLKKNEEGFNFHTNHCLGEKVIPFEDNISSNSTTHNRYELLDKKLSLTKTPKDLIALLTDHDEYPKSICSHFESGAQDPSMTCGGAVADLINKTIYFWRGCPEHDNNFKDYTFNLDDTKRNKEFTLQS